MKFRGGVVSADKAKGFIEITEFKGQSAMIGLDVLKEFVEFLKLLKTLGFEEIEVGVETNRPLLIFLNEEKTIALGFAPRSKGEY